jgi:hypothetical protein
MDTMFQTVFQTVKAITIAGALATSLPLFTGTANALTPYAWNTITPAYCYSYSFTYRGQKDTELAITDRSGTTIYALGSQVIGNLASSCMYGTSFQAYYNPTQAYFTTFYIVPYVPPLRDTPLHAGWNLFRPTYCETLQAIDSIGPVPTTVLWVGTQYFSFGIPDSLAIGGLFTLCDYPYLVLEGWNNGTSYWDTFFYDYFNGGNQLWQPLRSPKRIAGGLAGHRTPVSVRESVTSAQLQHPTAGFILAEADNVQDGL